MSPTKELNMMVITEINRLKTLTASEYAKEHNKLYRTHYFELVEDGKYWAEKGIHTGLDLAHELLAQSYSDEYKEKYGIRPRHVNFKELSFLEVGRKYKALIA